VVVVAVLAALLLQMGEVVVLVLSSSLTLALNVAQAAHTLQLAETQSTLSQQVERIRHKENHGSFCTN
jgi:hypothetical protein